MSDQARTRGRWIIVVGAGAVAAVVAGTVARRRARNQAVSPDAPADVAFMRALHAALRRDLSRLETVADQDIGTKPAPPTVLAGWQAFRRELDNHHTAEDEDLWPLLRAKLSDPADLFQVDAMVEEHRQIPAALAEVDTALRGNSELAGPARELSTVVRNHLDHEERTVLPLLERHFTRAEWRKFLVTERGRRPASERPQFLTWILDDASEQDATAVLTELPPPARVVYRRVLRPRYARQKRWQTQPSE